MIYLLLFVKFFLIGALSFGGGYGALPLIENTVVAEQGWLTYEEFADIITLSEVTPGPIALNAASFAGFRTAGLLGSIASTLGCTAPSCIIVSILAVLYMKYRSGTVFSSILGSIRPAVCAMIFSSFATVASLALFGASSIASITLASVNVASVLLFTGSLILLATHKVPPVAVILLAGVCGILLM